MLIPVPGKVLLGQPWQIVWILRRCCGQTSQCRATVRLVPAPSRAPNFFVELLREQRYQKHFLREDSRQNLAAMVVICVGYVISVANDFSAIDDNHLLLRYVSLTARALSVVLMAVTVIAFRRARWPRQWQRIFNVNLIGTAILASIVHMTKIPSGMPMGQLIASGGWICIIYFALRGPVRPRAIASGIIILAAIIIIVNSHGKLDAVIGRNAIITLLALGIAGFFSARSYDENRRTRFEAERRERHVRQALAIEKQRAEAMSNARAAFLAAMSHEFRTPMNAVIGLSDLLLDAPLANEHWRHVRTINESARGLLGMLNEILDFAKIDAQKLTLSPAPFDVRDLARSVVDMLQPQAKKKSLDLSLEITSDIPQQLIGDDARIRQALVNIVSNAVKFTEKGGVTLRIESRALGPNRYEIEFRVQDTGIGMAPEVLTRLFRPFEQANAALNRRYGGTGLGLSISKQIINAMGGEIRVESQLGQGSTFLFKLPLEGAMEAESSNRASLSEDRPALTILIVDDNAINRDVARAKFGQKGYLVDLANDGPSAIEAVMKKQYDVVFMDLRMPEMTGTEATERITEKLAGKAMPHIIAMTASVFEEDRAACRKVGMRDFVGKPVDMIEIDSLLRRIANERGVVAIVETPKSPLVKETIDGLKEMHELGQPDFLANLTQKFMTELEKRFPQMANALDQNDMRTLQDDAHLLKSASASLGAARMSELCARLEATAREGRRTEAQTIFDALSIERKAVERALLEEIGAES